MEVMGARYSSCTLETTRIRKVLHWKYVRIGDGAAGIVVKVCFYIASW